VKGKKEFGKQYNSLQHTFVIVHFMLTDKHGVC